MLLIMSGDIEANPGPKFSYNTTRTTPDSFVFTPIDVSRYLLYAYKFQRLTPMDTFRGFLRVIN